MVVVPGGRKITSSGFAAASLEASEYENWYMGKPLDRSIVVY
jgi:hypothetical protein